MEKRNVQRVLFEQPVRATLGGQPVWITDLGMRGVGIVAHAPLPTRRLLKLHGEVAGSVVEVTVEIMRCRLSARRGSGELVYRAGAVVANDECGSIRRAVTALAELEINALRMARGSNRIAS